MMNTIGMKPSSKGKFALVAALFILSSIALIFLLKTDKVSESKVELSPNESVEFSASDLMFSKTTNEFDFVIPLNTPNSKLLEIGNDKEFISLFKVENRAYLLFVGQGKQDKKFVTDPVGIPLDSDAGNYVLKMVLDEDHGTVNLKTSALSYVWKIPSEVGFSKINYLKSGNAPSVEYQLERVTDLNIIEISVAGLLLAVFFALVMNRKRLYLITPKLFLQSYLSRIKNTRFALGLLALGVIGLVFLPPSPPAGILSAATTDLSKLTKSDFSLVNEDLKGGWLFRNSPDVKYNPEDFSTTLSFEMDVFLDADTPYTEILAYGVPADKDSSPKSRTNFEITMNARQGLYYKAPSKDGRSNYYTGRLTKGNHQISGEIRDGRELELMIDGVLLYAMSSQAPIYLPTDPNIFISEYVLDNLRSGSVKWEVRSEAATPVMFAMHRAYLFATVAALLASVVLLGHRLMQSRAVKVESDPNSRTVLVSSFLTFGTLSAFGAVTWLMNLQPVASITQPRNYPLFLTQYRFSDFYQIFLSSQNKSPYEIAEVIYPPFGMLVLDLLGFFSARQAVTLVLTLAFATILTFFFATVLARKDLNRRERIGSITVSALSFPVIFAIDRGNLDLIIAALLLFAVWFNTKQASNKYATGALIGIASAIKIYPLFLLPIFFYQKRELRIIMTSVVTFMTLSIIGALHYRLGPLEFLKSVLLGSSGQELSVENALRWNGSLAALATTLVNLVAPTYSDLVWGFLSSSALLIVLLAIGTLIALWLAKNKVDVTSFSIVWISAISLAFPVTGAYRFTMFSLAFAFLVLYGIRIQNSLKTIGILIGVIVSPVVFWYFDDGAVNTFSLLAPTACIFSIGLIVKNIFKADYLPENKAQL